MKLPCKTMWRETIKKQAYALNFKGLSQDGGGGGGGPIFL